MIKIKENPVILRIIEQKTCATLIIINAVKLPFSVFHNIVTHSFMIRWTGEYDSISVHPIDENYDKVLNAISDHTSFTKIEVIK